jgi:putative FmdB family regulatory protein
LKFYFFILLINYFRKDKELPIFEYKCNDCNKFFEILHKSSSNVNGVECPDCNSKDIKKLISVFSPSSSSSPDFSGGCENGSCGLPSYGGGCPNGMCGLN